MMLEWLILTIAYRFSGVTGFDRCQSIPGERAEYSGSSRKTARKPS
jgi:hypothetical protein